jgi:pimeloyl-ACP methyl ester carboxylesterase
VLKKIDTDLLTIGYKEYENLKDSTPVILIHGFPYDINSFNDAAALLNRNKCRVLTPYLRGYGTTRFKSSSTMRSGQQAALAHDILDFMDALQIPKAILAGYDWGGRASCIVSALFPERVLGLVSVGGYTIQNIPASSNPLKPELEQLYWYQYYFHSERGKKGLSKYRKELCKILWTEWSPTWKFAEDTYNLTAAAFENPDFTDIVIHSYRHRFGLVAGDDRYEETEKKLIAQPKITVPTIVLDPGSDGVVPLIGDEDDSAFFSERYQRRVLLNIGHNLPQEAPEEFAQAILELINNI